MLINKETRPYRMGLSPLYFLPSPPVNVTNERLGYFPITPPYHHQYDYVLPTMQSPRHHQPATAVSSSSSSNVNAGMLVDSVDNGHSSLYYYMNAAGKEEITSVPLSPPHTPPLFHPTTTTTGSSILTGNGTSNGGETVGTAHPATNQYGLSNLKIAPDSGDDDDDDSAMGVNGGNDNIFNSNGSYEGGRRAFGARNSVIMKVENQQVVPLLSEESSRSIEQFVCKWENCYCVFFKLEDLASHVTQKHAVVGLGGLYYCRWENCLRQDRGFNARYKMLVHVRTHTKEKPHQCGNCGKCFSRAENLKIHLRSHSGEKPYVCPIEGCNKAYSNSSDRFKHTRTHSNDKPYVCKIPGCHKRYTDPSSLRKHVKTFKHVNLFVQLGVESDYHPHQHHYQHHPSLVGGGAASHRPFYRSNSDGSSGGSAGSPSKMASDNSYTDDSRASSTATTASSPELLDGEDNNVLIDVVNVDKCDEKLIFTDYRFCPSRRPAGQIDWPSGHHHRRRVTTPPPPDDTDRSLLLVGGDDEDDDGCERNFLIEPEQQDYRRPYSSFPSKGFLHQSSRSTSLNELVRLGSKDDECLLPTAVEDDDLCSAIRRLNGGRLIGMDAMEVDGPLDLSVHHR